ncbi:MAG: MBL fold metallo-hydrolase [Archangium sp.]|nr:MBL fold metallo-hydrolase [Archangium sp.]
MLVDPMLASKGALPPLKWLGPTRRRNPLVELPAAAPAILERVTHALITHCQRGHFDHLDRAGARFLRERNLPVLCMPRDAVWLEKRGLRVQPLCAGPIFGGQVLPIPCVHGRGLVGQLMEHGFGYFFDLPGEPTFYLAGDTLLTEDIKQHLERLCPEVSVFPAGGARFDVGGEIIMNAEDLREACDFTPGVVIANHLEALDHCPTTRAELRALADGARLFERVRIPLDGESYEFSGSSRR